MIEISHLVVDGCSLTYCQGLENPHIDGWPALLAKKIGVPVVNLALGGSGNDAIHRRQYDYFYRAKSFYDLHSINAKPYHIIGLSFAGRREEYFETYYQSPEVNRYFTLDLTPDFDKLKAIIDSGDTSPASYAAYIEYGYFLNFNLLAAHTKKLELWASLINLYKQHHVPYTIGDYIPTYDEGVNYKIKADFTEIRNFIYNDPNFCGNFSELTNHLKPLPCGHDGLEAQQIIADHVYNHMIKNHTEITVVPIPKLYTLRNYYIREKLVQVAQHSHWYKNS